MSVVLTYSELPEIQNSLINISIVSFCFHIYKKNHKKVLTSNKFLYTLVDMVCM